MATSGCDEDDLAASLSESARFTTIFERHLAEIHRYLAYRVGSDLADDLAAETFLRAFRGRRNFVSSEGSVTAWLYGIATNLVRHHRRDEQRRLRLRHQTALRDPSPSTGEEFVDRLGQQRSSTTPLLASTARHAMSSSSWPEPALATRRRPPLSGSRSAQCARGSREPATRCEHDWAPSPMTLRRE
jgi:DNA-directed RNA polymerase specialized sigma24 family protein